MKSTRTSLRPRKLAVTSLGLGVAVATVLAGCTDAGGGGGEGQDSGVPWGASAAEYQAALADMDPVELIVQHTAPSADSPDAHAAIEFYERVEEYSGGKITFEVTYASGIVSNVLEAANALVDGRMDIAYYWPQYDPAEYPVNNLLVDATVVRDPRLVTGFYSIMGAMQEVALNTPEALAEWTDKGITPLNGMSPDGATIIACREPVESLADFEGRQTRAGGTVHARQIEGIGGIPVSLPYPEVFEALQRGILDCSMSAHSVATSAGHIEVAPYVYHTEQFSFASTPTELFAGPRLKTLPIAAQQLILESAQLDRGNAFNRFFERVTTETYPTVLEHGGGFYDFPADIEERLEEMNQEILADIEASNLIDGADFIERLHAANEKWIALVEELGYTDSGSVASFPDWYEGPFPVEPWVDAVIQEVLSKYAPL